MHKHAMRFLVKVGSNVEVQRRCAASLRSVLWNDGFGHANNKRAYFQLRLGLR